MRFIQRNRHDGHLDSNKNHEELIVSFHELSSLGPLGIGHLIKVDTSDELDIVALIDDIKENLL